MGLGVIASPIAFAGVMLAWALGVAGWGAFESSAIAGVLCLPAVLCGLCVITLQGWCTNGRAASSVGLLAASGMALVILSCPAYLDLVRGTPAPVAPAIAPMIADSISFLGIVIAMITTPIILVEVLLRWASSGVFTMSEGLGVVLRLIGSLLVISVGSALIQEEGLARLLDTLHRMRL